MNPAYNALMKAGPDAFGNQFDCYLIYTKGDGGRDTITPENSKYTDGYKQRTDTIDYNVFATRIESIEVPALYAESGEIDFGGIKIATLGAAKKFDNTSSLTVRLDQDLYVIDMFDILSGGKTAKLEATPYEVNTNIAFARMSSHSSLTRTNLSILIRRSNYSQLAFGQKKTVLDMTVLGYNEDDKNSIDYLMTDDAVEGQKRYQEYWKKRNEELGKDSPFTETNTQMNQWFVMEGVNFYGSEDALTFNSSGGDSATRTYNFTFKNLFFLNTF